MPFYGIYNFTNTILLARFTPSTVSINPSTSTAHQGIATIEVKGVQFRFFQPTAIDPAFGRLPICLKILAENVLRNSPAGIPAFHSWLAGNGRTDQEVEFRPARVLMHDTTCVPALVDLATLRDAVDTRGGKAAAVNPTIPVDLVIDHSVMVDHFGSPQAAAQNLAREFERNRERYEFIRWAEKNLANFRVVPPGAGIIHQINLEHLSEVVRMGRSPAGDFLYPDTLVGTDSHTPMVNALGILGWGVGGLEGSAAALGEPLTLHLPEVAGVRLTGRLPAGVTATDLALTLTQRLRQHGVVDKFVEFFGPGVSSLSVADRATVANMAPEYGATCSFFPIDQRTLDYLRMVGRSEAQQATVAAYARAQGLWHDPAAEAVFTELIELDLAQLEPCVAGPKRPEDKLALSQVRGSFLQILPELAPGVLRPRTVEVKPEGYTLQDGAVLIAAITSCTNTSNPALMIGAGLLARKARAAGLQVPPWVKTSLSPGSHAVTDYLQAAGLQSDLDALGFQVTGYGCMTCIGNSGPLGNSITKLTSAGAVAGAAVLSGNRNFQGRINPEVGAAYLASPALVVAYALAGSVLLDFKSDPIGFDRQHQPVFLHQLWPSDAEIGELINRLVTPAVFRAEASQIFAGPAQWREIQGNGKVTFGWRPDSTYLRRAPFFDSVTPTGGATIDVREARALLVLGDNVTTDHISPAGMIPAASLAGHYLREHHVPVTEFNQYSTRRGNHEVMLRGIFSNPRLRNELVPAAAGGGLTRDHTGEVLSIYEAGRRYRKSGTPLLIFAGRNYGAGSSRDWAAKGPALLGVRAVIAESFERIHRSNLIGMGILPLQIPPAAAPGVLKIDGTESFDLAGLDGPVHPRQKVELVITSRHGGTRRTTLLLRVETEREGDYLRHGGLLKYMLNQYVPNPSS